MGHVQPAHGRHLNARAQKVCPKVTAADMAEIETRMIAVVGKAREGKSTLMDQVIETMNGEATTTTSGDVLRVIAGTE